LSLDDVNHSHKQIQVLQTNNIFVFVFQAIKMHIKCFTSCQFNIFQFSLKKFWKISRRKTRKVKKFSSQMLNGGKLEVYFSGRGVINAGSDLILPLLMKKPNGEETWSGVNFDNIIGAAFARIDPKSAKMTIELLGHFCAFGI
jgi:hypothetical protein